MKKKKQEKRNKETRNKKYKRKKKNRKGKKKRRKKSPGSPPTRATSANLALKRNITFPGAKLQIQCKPQSANSKRIGCYDFFFI
jgi:hypothetical protein